MDALTEKPGTDQVEFDVQNASGDTAACTQLVNTFVSNEVDLIIATASPRSAGCDERHADIPVLCTAVTDYATAKGVSGGWTGMTGINVSSTSDRVSLDAQAAMIKELLRETKKAVQLYCTDEPNSGYQFTVISGHLKDWGYGTKEYTFADANDVSSVIQNAADECEVIYIPAKTPPRLRFPEARRSHIAQRFSMYHSYS